MTALFRAAAGYLAQLLGKLFAKASERFIKNAAATVVLVSAYIAMVAALAGTISLILSGLAMAMPSDLVQGFAMFKPDNFDECIGAYLATKVALWIYHTKSKFLEWEAMRKYV